jgi:hypothetical protein
MECNGWTGTATGGLDLALTGNGKDDGHFLFRNRLPVERAHRSLAVDVLDARGRRTRAGSEIRLYSAGTGRILGARLMDTGSGYCSQNAMPVHLGLPEGGRVDVEVTFLTKAGRKVARVTGVDPSQDRRTLVVKAP